MSRQIGYTLFQAAHRLVVGLAGGDLRVVVGAVSARPRPHLGERRDVPGEDELAMAAEG
jgi:hypothetical protein